jgi:hypothetical protein
MLYQLQMLYIEWMNMYGELGRNGDIVAMTYFKLLSSFYPEENNKCG